MADKIFESMKHGLKGRTDLVKQVNAVYQWNLNTANGVKSYTIDLKNGEGDVHEGPAKAADCTLTLSEQDFIAMTEGKLNSQQVNQKILRKKKKEGKGITCPI